MHYAEAEQFSLIWKRACRAQDGFPGLEIEDRILPVVKAFNACRGTAVVQSSSGYNEEHIRDPKVVRARASILFAIADPKCDYVIRTISDWMMAIRTDESYGLRPELVMTTIPMDNVTRDFDEQFPEHEGAYYRAWSLEIRSYARPRHVANIQRALGVLADRLTEATAIELSKANQ